MVRFYFFIVFLLVVIISFQLAVRSFFLSPNSPLAFIVPPVPFGRGVVSGEPINFDFVASAFRRVRLSQGYGATRFAALRYPSRWHNGVDIAAKVGSPIHSPTAGTVLLIGDQDRYCPRRGYGKFAVIENAADKAIFLYAHLSEVSAKKGAKIKKDQVIGLTGSTGFSTASHLHVTVFKPGTFAINEKDSCGPNPEGQDVNPIAYFDALKKAAEAK